MGIEIRVENIQNWMVVAWTVIENQSHVLLLFALLVLGILANGFIPCRE